MWISFSLYKLVCFFGKLFHHSRCISKHTFRFFWSAAFFVAQTKAEVTSIPSSNSHFVEAAIDAVSRLKSWRVLLQLPRGVGTAVIHSSDSFKTHSFSSTADNGLEIATLIELCSVLGNLNTTSKVATTPSFASIPCGVGISLIFDPKVLFIHFEANLPSPLHPPGVICH